MGTKKAAATVAVKGKGVNSGFILRIIIGLLFICLGIQGYVGGGKGAMGVGDLYNAFDSEVMIYILATIVLLSGVILLVPMFIRGISEKIVRAGMIVVLIIWVAVIIFADFINMPNNPDWLEWIQMFLYHLIVLFGILQVCGKALLK